MSDNIDNDENDSIKNVYIPLTRNEKVVMKNKAEKMVTNYEKNQQNEIRNAAKNQTLISNADNGINVNSKTIRDNGAPINIFTTKYQSSNNVAPPVNLGCFQINYDNISDSNLNDNVVKHGNFVEKHNDTNIITGNKVNNYNSGLNRMLGLTDMGAMTFDKCKNTAIASNKPFFAIGPGRDTSDDKFCLIGDNSLLEKLTHDNSFKKGYNIVEYDNLLKNNTKFNITKDNSGGSMKIKDGTINFYDANSAYFTSLDNLISYDANQSDTSYYSIETYAENLLSTNDPYFSENPDIRINFFDQQGLNIPNDPHNMHQRMQTICNNLPGCVGYTHAVDQNNNNIFYLFKDMDEKFKIQAPIAQPEFNSEGKNYKSMNSYTKADYSTANPVLKITNEGKLIFNRNNKDVVLIDNSEENISMISPNTDFINKRKGNKNFMKEGEYLMPGEFIASNNGIYRAIMSDNGNLVMEKTLSGCSTNANGNFTGSADPSVLSTANPGNFSLYTIPGVDYNVSNNTTFPATQITYFDNTNKADCLVQCNNNERCSGFSFLKDINKCVLYQNINKNKPAQNNNIDFFDKNVKPVMQDDSLGKLGYISERGILHEYNDQDITLTNEYYKPLMNTQVVSNKLFTGAETSNGHDVIKNELGIIDMHSYPIGADITSIDDVCKDKCNELEDCAGYSTRLNGNQQTCFTHNKEIYNLPKIPVDVSNKSQVSIKKPVGKSHISIPKGVVKVDNKTWNSFKKGENMNPEIVSRKVKQLNKNKQQVYDSGMNMQSDTYGTIESYTNVKNEPPSNSEIKRRAELIKQLQNTPIVEGNTNMGDAVANLREQHKINNQSRSIFEATAEHNQKNLDKNLDEIVTWGIIGVITLILGNDLINYTKV